MSCCTNVSLNSSRVKNVWVWDGGHPVLTVWNWLNYTRIENAHKVRNKTFVSCYVGFKYTTTGGRVDMGLCEPFRSIRLNCQLMTVFDMMHILQAQEWGCVSTHPWLPNHKTKRESCDASRSQLNQASWNRTFLKYGSENQLNVHNYLSIFFCDILLIAKSRKIHVTITPIPPFYWIMWELLAFEYVRTSVDKNKFRKFNSMQHVLVALQ